MRELEHELLLEYHESLKTVIQENTEQVIKQFYQGAVIGKTTRDKLIQQAEESTSNGAENLLREVEDTTKKDASNTFFKVLSIMRSASVLNSSTELGIKVNEIEKAYWHRQQKIKARRKSSQGLSSNGSKLSPNSKATKQLDAPSETKHLVDDSPKHFKALASVIETEQESQQNKTTAPSGELQLLVAPVQENPYVPLPQQETEMPLPLASQTSDPGASIQAALDEETLGLRKLTGSATKFLSDLTTMQEKAKERHQLEQQLADLKEFYEEQYKLSKVVQSRLHCEIETANMAHVKELEQIEQKHKEEMEEKNDVASMEHSLKQVQQLQQTQRDLDELQTQLSEKEKECKSLQEKLTDMEQRRDEIKGEIKQKKEQLGIMTLKRNLQRSKDWKDKLSMCQEIQELARQICDGLTQEQIKELSGQMEEKIKLLQKRRTSQSWPRKKHS